MGCEKQKPRSKGKGLDEPCLICGERRHIDRAHFPKRKNIGGKRTILLCPTHHELLDDGRLSKNEFEKIWLKKFKVKAGSVEEFVGWAYENCYQYNVDDLKRKFWNYKTSK